MTRWGRGQKLIHGVRTVDLLGYVLAGRNVIVKAEVLPAQNQSGPSGGGGGGSGGGGSLEGFDKCEDVAKSSTLKWNGIGLRPAQYRRSPVVTPSYGQMSFL